MEETPFPEFQISSSTFLDRLSGRQVCPLCGKSRKYYCYTCYVPIQGLEKKIPRVKLPIKIDIIKHPSECDGKSTAAHAAVLAPDDVTIYTYPCIPDYPDKERTVLIFPGEKSLTLEELAEDWGNQEITCEQGKKLLGTGTAFDNCNNESRVQSCDNVQGKDNSGWTGSTGTHDSSSPENIKSQGDGVETQSGVSHSSVCISANRAESGEIESQIPSSRNQNAGAAEKAECEDVSMDRKNFKRKFDNCYHSNCDAEENIFTDPADCLAQMKKARVSSPFDRAVFIDSTWNQTKKIYLDERLKGLRCVELKTRKTKFWRHQKEKPDTYLATIEAIYYFLHDYHGLFMPQEYSGEYDNLLFFFCYMYQKIRHLYDGGKHLKAYKKNTGDLS